MQAAGLETYRGIAHPWFCDSMGHMNTRHYAAMFDDASFHLLGAIAGPAALAAEQRGWADVRHTHEFRHEARAGALVIIRSAVTRLGTKSVTYRHAMTNVETGALNAVSEIVTVLFDLERRAAIALTEPIRTSASAMLVEGFAP
jgi:acyl-CoA thioester hydrolase